MSKDKKLIPELRFPEFKSDGEWEEIKLKQCATFYRGLTYGQEDIADNGLLVLRSGNIQNDTLVLIKDLVYVQKDCPDDLKLMNGDVVICMSNGSKSLVGKNAEYRGEYSGNITVGAFCSIMRPKNRFTKYLLQSDSYQTFIALSIGGGNINNLKNSDLEEFECAVPKKNLEQQKIASCLSSLDEVITAHSQKLELLKDHKKGLMQNLFPQEGEKVPKYRFKEFEKDGEWSLKQLGVDNLIEIKGRIGYRGYTTEDIVSKGEGAISMSPSNIDENWNLDFEKSTYITWEKYEESPEIMLEDGFTALVKTGSSYGKAAYIKNLVEKTTINPQLVVLKPKQINSYFLYMLVTNTAVQKQIQETVVGGAIPTLSQDSISKFEVLIPKPKEQQKIAECFSALNDLIIQQTQRIEQLKLHKKGLMQGLFPKIID